MAQEGSQQVEPTRVNDDEQEVHDVLPAAEHVKQDESQEAQAPVLARYFPGTQEAQFEEVIPVQVAQEVWQQVEPTRANEDEDWQERQEVLPAALQVKQDESQALQTPPLKYFPVIQEEQVEEVVPEQVAQEGSQQVEPTRVNDDEQEVHPVLPATLHVKQDESQVLQTPPLKYFPAIQEEQLEEVVPEQVAQEGSQQVEPTRVKDDEQEAHAVLPDPEHVEQEESQALQTPPLKYFPAIQDAQLVDNVPLQVAQEGSQQVVPILTNDDEQEAQAVLPAPVQVKQDESQA